MRDYAVSGLTFKLMSWKMAREAPDALTCICHARKFGNIRVLQEGEWSAIKAIHGIAMVGNADNAQSWAYDSFLLRVRNVAPPALISSEGFSELVALVHRLGVHHHSLVDQLLTFGRLMVNPKTTKLRWKTLHTILLIDASAPHTILALLYFTYCIAENPTTRHLPDTPDRFVRLLGASQSWLDACEQMLRYVNQERVRTLLEETYDRSDRFNFATQLCMKQTDIAIRVIEAVVERYGLSKQNCSLRRIRQGLRIAVREMMVSYGIRYDRLPSPPSGMEWLTSATAEKRKHDSLDEPHTYSVAQHGSAHDVVQQRPEQETPTSCSTNTSGPLTPDMHQCGGAVTESSPKKKTRSV